MTCQICGHNFNDDQPVVWPQGQGAKILAALPASLLPVLFWPAPSLVAKKYDSARNANPVPPIKVDIREPFCECTRKSVMGLHVSMARPICDTSWGATIETMREAGRSSARWLEAGRFSQSTEHAGGDGFFTVEVWARWVGAYHVLFDALDDAGSHGGNVPEPCETWITGAKSTDACDGPSRDIRFLFTPINTFHRAV